MIENKWGKLFFDGKGHRKGRSFPPTSLRVWEEMWFYYIYRENYRPMLTLMQGQTGGLGDESQDREMLIDAQVPRLDAVIKWEQNSMSAGIVTGG